MSKTKSKSNETPLMKQYNNIKARHPGALLLFRVGDFYETFGEDAVKASKVLDIVLTKRSNGAASDIELAGFPHHALDSYLPKLVRAGNRVAICDQLEDPKSAKGIVRRGVTELVTPGLSFNDHVLEKNANNYLASIQMDGDQSGVAFLDVSTGEFYTSTGTLDYIDNLLQNFHPSEVIYSKGKKKEFAAYFKDTYNTFTPDEWVFAHDYAYERLTSHFKTTTLKGFGIENLSSGIIAAGAILYYLEETEHKEVGHIASISRIEEEKYVWLDKFTIRNLELIFPQQEGGVPLIDVLDHTITAMGGRLMKKWLIMPLKEQKTIADRLEMVDALHQGEPLRHQLAELLHHIADLERLIGKVAVRRINPREMVLLRKSLEHILPIKDLLKSNPMPQWQKLSDQINPCEFLLNKISTELKEDVPMVSNMGNLIRDGVDQELDDLRKIAFSGKDFLVQIQQREIENTGISSLKIAYNKVFGYYLEVTNSHKDKVPSGWIRKQTLVNAERYITEELKQYEEKILGAEDQIHIIEQRLFNDLVESAADFVGLIQQNARAIAAIDCLVSFASMAAKNEYVKPKVTDGKTLHIQAGRHPVIERQLALGEEYVPNDVFLDNDTQQIMIITGPNMAGKSALLRQTALIVLMAQMGSFVPAARAEIGVIDKVFTRVGASDNLAKGESTFMVEMTETASILNNLSDRSLVLMDEIGRGTSTYDGISIAWSIVEFLHNHSKHRAKTLFATHYHELNQLMNDFPRIRNYNVSVKESGDRIIFLRKLKEGGSRHSFGIHVAQMAGMPNAIVIRANEIMHHLEKEKISKNKDRKVEQIPKASYQLSMFEADPRMEEVRGLLSQTDVNSISPIEALMKLNEMKNILKGGK
jgi:DNA mismatch repair protein MutS